MFDELLPTSPRSTLQVVVPKRSYQPFRLVQPRSMRRRESRTPPAPALGPVRLRLAGRVTGVAVLNQKDPVQPSVPTAKGLQLPDVVRRVLLGLHGNFHLTVVDHQEQQHINGAVPRVLELLLLDGAWQSLPNRVPLQNLVVRDLIHRDGPDALASQTLGLRVAPKYFLGPLLELGIEPCGSPVTRAMRLQIHVVQDASHGAGTDGVGQTIDDRLASQILAGPVGDVESFGDRLQAGQLHDLGTLQGGKMPGGVPGESHLAGELSARPAHTGGRRAKRSRGHIPTERQARRWVLPKQRQARYGHVGPGTKLGAGYGQHRGEWARQRAKASSGEVCGRAWSDPPKLRRSSHSTIPQLRISCITYG